MFSRPQKGFAVKGPGKMKWIVLVVLLCTVYPCALVLAQSRESAPQEGGTETTIRITADRLESNHKMSMVEFSGSVTAIEDDVVITADRMKIFYKVGAAPSAEAGTIEKIISEGNVKIVFDKETKTAMADKAVYSADRKTLELTGGDPRVWSGKNVVRGKKITLFQAEDRSLVEGADQDQVEATLYVKEEDGLK